MQTQAHDAYTRIRIQIQIQTQIHKQIWKRGVP